MRKSLQNSMEPPPSITQQKTNGKKLMILPSVDLILTNKQWEKTNHWVQLYNKSPRMTTLQNIYKKDNSTTNHQEQILYNKSPIMTTLQQITKNDHFFTNHQEQQLYNKSQSLTTPKLFCSVLFLNNCQEQQCFNKSPKNGNSSAINKSSRTKTLQEITKNNSTTHTSL